MSDPEPHPESHPEEPGAAGPPVSRLSRMLRRTWVGALLVAGLCLLLWLAARSPSGTLVLLVGTLLSWLAVFELSRMGTLGGRGLALSLWPAAVALLVLNVLLTAPRFASGELHAPRFTFAELVASYALALLVSTVSLVEVRFTLWKRPFLISLFAALALGLLLAGGFDFSALEIRWPGAAALTIAFCAVLALAITSARKEGGERIWSHLSAAAWLLVPLPALVHVWSNHGFHGLVALIVLSKIGDIAGYYVGSAIGRVHPFPNLSPGKTLEGCLASLAAGTLMGAACVLLGWLPSQYFGWQGGLAAGLAINLAAQAGDLFESRVKRRAGVKDSGWFCGPSGGALDVLDSLLFTVPTALVVWPLLFT